MKIKADDYTIYKNERNDLAFVISYTGTTEKKSPAFIYERAKNSAVLQKSDDISVMFQRININAIAALKKASSIYIIETENDFVKDEYWAKIKEK